MGVIARSFTAFGFVAVGACLGVLAAGLAGCSTGTERAASQGPPQSVDLTPTTVAPPARPRAYALPAGALTVSSSRELEAALANGRRDTIVLAPGVYDGAGPFVDGEGDRLYAAGLGRAVFRAGIVLGSNLGPPGAALRGLTFDVSDRSKTLDGAIVHVWGSASNASVLDTRLYGNRRVATGLLVRQPRGFVGRRLVADGFLSYGVAVDPNDVGYRTRAPFSLSDLVISRVRRTVRGSSNGRAEACLWLGSPGAVRRVSVRRCGITGIWTGTATRGSRVSDATIDRTHVGIYVEHFTSGTTFAGLRVGPNVARGVNAEWSNLALGHRPASSDNVIEDALFRTTHVGVYLDEGTTRTTVRRCIFAGQAWAAIGDYLGRGNAYSENDFGALAGGAVAVSHDHDPAGGAGP